MSIYCSIKKKMGKFHLDIQFEAENETIALMGASGCGKSMTLRCIAGVEKPDHGKIIINGVTVFDSEKKINLPPQKRRTGYLFQDYALFPNMTVHKNIQTVLAKERWKEIPEILELYHLSNVAHQYPAQLSGGQKQRCALARMMVTSPQIILLDEPFSALDSYLRWQMEQEVVSVIEKSGRTVLFVSHDRDEVYRISNRVVVIDKGRNEKITEKHLLYQNPQTYVDALLTGCKNICPALIENGLLTAERYGMQIPWEKLQNRDFHGGPQDLAYIGVRAKKIRPAHLFEDQTQAVFLSYRILSVTEGVFSMILMIETAEGGQPIRWEVSKEEYAGLKDFPSQIAVPLSELLLLS